MEHTSTGIYLTDEEIELVLFALRKTYDELRLHKPRLASELLEDYATLINKFGVKPLDNDK